MGTVAADVCVHLFVVAQSPSHAVSSETPWIVAGWVLCPWDFPGRSKGVGCHFLFQGISQAQGSNLRLLNWQAGSLPLSHQGRPFLSYRGWVFMEGVGGASHRGAGRGAVSGGRARQGFLARCPLTLHAQPSSEGLCGVRVRLSPQVQFQAAGWTGLSVSREVAATIFTAPARTFYRKVQLQYKQNVRVWLVS